LIDQGQPDQAAAILNRYLSQKPDSADACNLLWQIHQKKSDQNACVEILARLCAIHAKAGEVELAWKCYEDFLEAGGQQLPAAAWLDVCRAAEQLQHFDRALAEYERLAEAYSTERQSILALLAAGRLCLKRLNQPERAIQFFETASKSPVPHLDWEQSITAGLRAAQASASQKAATAGASH
jgi:tetratricopeptide (TPR) repeat protein